jgi:hypothetical protein
LNQYATTKKYRQVLNHMGNTAKAAFDQGTITAEAYEGLIAAGLEDKRVRYDEWGGIVVDTVDETPASDEIALGEEVADDGEVPPAEEVRPVEEEQPAEEQKPEDDIKTEWDTLQSSRAPGLGKNARGGDLQGIGKGLEDLDFAGTIDICPTGNVLLDMPSGKGEKHLLVSRSILWAASPVMAEKIRGLSWLKRKTGELLHLELLDEDQMAMEVVCNAIHFRTDHLPATFSPTDLLRIGSIAEKYAFREALRAWGTKWLSRALLDAKPEDLHVLLEAARLLDAWEEYSHISLDMVRLQIGPFGHGRWIAADTVGK